MAACVASACEASAVQYAFHTLRAARSGLHGSRCSVKNNQVPVNLPSFRLFTIDRMTSIHQKTNTANLISLHGDITVTTGCIAQNTRCTTARRPSKKQLQQQRSSTERAVPQRWLRLNGTQHCIAAAHGRCMCAPQQVLADTERY